MATQFPSPTTSPDPMQRAKKGWTKSIERGCCSVATYFPLAFVYGLTTWAVWVEAGLGFRSGYTGWKSTSLLLFAVVVANIALQAHFSRWLE